MTQTVTLPCRFQTCRPCPVVVVEHQKIRPIIYSQLSSPGCGAGASLAPRERLWRAGNGTLWWSELATTVWLRRRTLPAEGCRWPCWSVAMSSAVPPWRRRSSRGSGSLAAVTCSAYSGRPSSGANGGGRGPTSPLCPRASFSFNIFPLLPPWFLLISKVVLFVLPFKSK